MIITKKNLETFLPELNSLQVAKLRKLIEDAELGARIDELTHIGYMINQNLGTKHAYEDRIAELKAQLTKKDLL